MAVPVEPGPNLKVGEATSLFEREFPWLPDIRNYDLSPDGRRFLWLRWVDLLGPTTAETAILPQAILVKNWFEELTRLVPID